MNYTSVVEAHTRIRPYVHRTPVLTSAYFNSFFNAELYFKAEHLQKVGAFKARGACNAVLQIQQDKLKNGVVSHSSGNHGQALAYAASIVNTPCTIIMPSNAPEVKKDAVRYYGAQIIECEPTLLAREQTVEAFVEKHDAYFVHPYNNEDVILGQGTAALELIQDVQNLDIVIAPVGGGGLISGTTIAVLGSQSHTTVIAAEPEVANDAEQSMLLGVIQPPTGMLTIADGLRASLGTIAFSVLKENRIPIITATEKNIRAMMFAVIERMKQVIEPSASVTLAAMLQNPEMFAGKKVGVILCGGNVDIRSV